MKKKTETKENEEKMIAPSKVIKAMKGETIHFIIGLLCVIFGVYMLLAFTSFFFTGGNDQSILAHPDPGELLETENRIQNYAGARGAQLSQFLINDCFGISAYLIVVFLIVAGMKLMKAYQFTLWKWFIGCSVLMIWISVTLGFAFGGTFQDTFLYPGGLHGYNVSQWICSQIGAPGLILTLLVTLILIAVFFTRETMQIVRKTLHPTLPLRNNKEKNRAEEKPKTEEAAPVNTSSEPVTDKSADTLSDSGSGPIELELDPIENKEEEPHDDMREEQVPLNETLTVPAKEKKRGNAQ